MDMLQEVVRILTIYQGEVIIANPNVPEEMEHYARAAMDIPDNEYVMAAMRTSFKKFHRGIIFGRDGIYWINGPAVETDVNHLTWRELSERKKQIRSLYKKIGLGEGAVFDNSGTNQGNTFLMRLLDLLIERYEEQETTQDGFIFEPEEPGILVRTIPTNKAELKADNAASAAEAGIGLGAWMKGFFTK
ncbi:hypothetical protein ACR30L_03550 [Psychromonas sp. PT13]|uniref:hypothetical protein n=1 Tax=Psychromonas sp. PT13 TaxID=3439547 RepID=UPI003EC02A3D